MYPEIGCKAWIKVLVNITDVNDNTENVIKILGGEEI